MKKEAGVYKLCTNDLKIIETISLLNEMDLYPLAEGVFKIVNGDDSPEIALFKNFSTYKTLVSYNSKKISRLIIMLIRYKYLERIYDENTNELYLKVSDKGDRALVDYHKKHKYKFVTKKVNNKPLFVKIEK